jgi:hypothetical protein
MAYDPEHASVEVFVEFLMDDERETFDHRDLQQLNEATQRRLGDLRRELEGYGLTLAHRAVSRRVRGVTTNSNDRWYGPGSERMHGGSGWEQIARFAGEEG